MNDNAADMHRNRQAEERKDLAGHMARPNGGPSQWPVILVSKLEPSCETLTECQLGARFGDDHDIVEHWSISMLSLLLQAAAQVFLYNLH